MDIIKKIKESLIDKRWFLEINRLVKCIEIVESQDFSSYQKVLVRITLDDNQQKDYLFPLTENSKNNIIDFSEPRFLANTLLESGISDTITSIEKPHEKSTNPVFFINNKYCLKFYPRIIYEENRELLYLQKLKGLDCVIKIIAWQMFQDEHCFCLITKLEPNAESAWDGINKLLKQKNLEGLKNHISQYAHQIAKLHITLKESFPYNDSLDSKKEAYYNGLAAALRELNSTNLSINVKQLSPLQYIHGDLHLGQILTSASNTGEFLKITDFEGAPLESLHSRKALKSPYHDIAGMLRSIDYAIMINLKKENEETKERYREALSQSFLDAYFKVIDPNNKLDHKTDQFIVNLYCLQRSIYEISYEQKSRPDWVWIPQAGFERIKEKLFNFN